MGTSTKDCKNYLIGLRRKNLKKIKGKDKRGVFDKRYITNWTTTKKYNEHNQHCVYCAEYSYLKDKYDL